MLMNKIKVMLKSLDASEGTFGANPVVVKVFYGILQTHLQKHTTLPLAASLLAWPFNS